MQSSDEKYTPAGVLRFQPALALFSYPFFFSVAWTLIFVLSWHKKEQYYIWASQAFESHSRFTASRLGFSLRNPNATKLFNCRLYMQGRWDCGLLIFL